MSQPRKIGRRGFMKYATAGAIAAVAGIGYLTKDYWSPTVPHPITPSPTVLPTKTPTPKPLKAAFDYTPKYRYILQDPTQTSDFRNLTEYSGDTKPTCAWSVDDQRISEDWNCSTKLTPGEHTVRLTARDGKTSDWTAENIEVDEYGPDYAKKELKIRFKGIVYMAGVRSFLDPIPSEARTKEDLELIRDDKYGLGCNAIRISGDNNDAIIRRAEIAIDNKFELIKLNPRYVDSDEQHTLKLSEVFSKKAENLRSTASKSIEIQYQIGQELSMDCSTIVASESSTYTERAQALDTLLRTQKFTDSKTKLLNLLHGLTNIARENFNGKISYAQGPWENIEWSSLDIDVRDSNEYTYAGMSFGEYESRIKMFIPGSKPFHITEFGAVTFSGAGKHGGSGWLYDGVYDEESQAQYIQGYLDVFNKVRPEAIFLFCWNEPTHNGRKLTQTFGIVREENEQHTWSPTIEIPMRKKKSFHMYKSYIKSS